MPTPQEIYDSPVYRKLSETPQVDKVSWEHFKTVYEALGEVLKVRTKPSKDIVASKFAEVSYR